MVAKFKFLIEHVTQKPTQPGFFLKTGPTIQHYNNIFFYQRDAKISVPAEARMDCLLFVKYLKLVSEAHSACM